MAEDTITEEWRVVEGFPHYQVSNKGNARRFIPSNSGKVGKNLIPQMTWGYKHVTLCRGPGTKPVRLKLHRLVCAAFNGPSPSSQHQVAHNNGDKLDCSAVNVRWATSKENHADRYIHGSVPLGERHHGTVLTEKQVIEIRNAPRDYGTGRALAKQYGTTACVVCDIRKGRSWAWLPDDPD